MVSDATSSDEPSCADAPSSWDALSPYLISLAAAEGLLAVARATGPDQQAALAALETTVDQVSRRCAVGAPPDVQARLLLLRAERDALRRGKA